MAKRVRGAALSAAELRLLVDEVIDDAIYVLDPTGAVVSWNKGATGLYGYEASEVMGRHFSMFYVESDRASGACDRELQVASEVGRYAVEGWRVRKDGQRFWASVRITALRDRRGQLRGFVRVIRDLTERKSADESARKRAEDAAARVAAEKGQLELARARAQFEATFQAMNDGVMIFDTEGRLVLVNEAQARILRFPDVASLYRDLAYFAELFELADERGQRLAVERWPISRILAGKTVTDEVYRARRTDTGDEWFYSFSGKPVLDESGQPVFGLIITRDITAQKRAEAALRESEARYRGTFDNAAVGIAHVALDGRWLELNDGLCAITGYSREELLSTDFQSISHPDDLKKDLVQVERLIRGEITTYSMEKRYLRKGGGEIWANLTVSARRNADGSVGGFITVVEDISARKRTELALRENQQLLRSTMENFPSEIAFKDREGRFLDVNGAVERALGLPKKEILGRSIAYFIPAEAAELQRQHELEVMASRQATQREEIVPTRSGTLFRLNTAFPLIDSSGGVYGTGHIAQDITELKRMQEELRSSEQQFRALADSIPQLAWIADADGAIHWYNKRWYEYTGTTPAEMEGEGGWGWKRVHDPGELPRVIARFKEALESGEPWEDMFPLRRSDGEMRWHLSRAMPLRDAQGRIIKWFGTNTDVEEQRRQADELQKAVEARDEFLSVASHELKTPLTPLTIKLQHLSKILDSGQPPSPEIAERLRGDLRAMVRQVHRLTALVNDLLDVGLISTGQMGLHPERLDMAELVREVVARFEPQADRVGSRIHVEAQSKLVGQWDRLRVEQVCGNLLSNAIKYGAGEPIQVKVDATGDRVRIIVADRGIGVPQSVLPHIFDKFVRGVSERNYGGLGLGLYVTKQIVSGMGGAVSVVSAEGDGATFTVELPREEPRTNGDSAQV